MGRTVLRLTLREVLARRSDLAANATLYAPSDTPHFAMDTPMIILLDDGRSKHAMHRLNTDDRYLLEVNLVDDVLMALENALDRAPTDIEIVRAVNYYGTYDAFISREQLDRGIDLPLGLLN